MVGYLARRASSSLFGVNQDRTRKSPPHLNGTKTEELPLKIVFHTEKYVDESLFGRK